MDEELLRYDEYMDHVRGLAPKTRDIALRIVGRLLASRFGEGAIEIAAIKPDHVRRFFAQQAKLYSKPANTGSVVATLRGYLPKGSDLSLHSQDDLDAIADSLNSRPRATHAFHSPLEVFARMLALAHQPSASIH